VYSDGNGGGEEEEGQSPYLLTCMNLLHFVGDPNGWKFQTGLADGIAHPGRVCHLFVFSDLTVPFEVQDPGSFPVHFVVLIIGVLGQS
jgi:hypothetical protein